MATPRWTHHTLESDELISQFAPELPEKATGKLDLDNIKELISTQLRALFNSLMDATYTTGKARRALETGNEAMITALKNSTEIWKEYENKTVVRSHPEAFIQKTFNRAALLLINNLRMNFLTSGKTAELARTFGFGSKNPELEPLEYVKGNLLAAFDFLAFVQKNQHALEPNEQKRLKELADKMGEIDRDHFSQLNENNVNQWMEKGAKSLSTFLEKIGAVFSGSQSSPAAKKDAMAVIKQTQKAFSEMSKSQDELGQE